MSAAAFSSDAGFRAGGCYCTGECQSNPCHPCNGGLGGAARTSTPDGWRCPTCGTVYAPWVFTCAKCKPPTYIQPDCGCTGPLCEGGVACPRRVVVTSTA